MSLKFWSFFCSFSCWDWRVEVKSVFLREDVERISFLRLKGGRLLRFMKPWCSRSLGLVDFRSDGKDGRYSVESKLGGEGGGEDWGRGTGDSASFGFFCGDSSSELLEKSQIWHFGRVFLRNRRSSGFIKGL